jgi:hypothetical protein
MMLSSVLELEQTVMRVGLVVKTLALKSKSSGFVSLPVM